MVSHALKSQVDGMIEETLATDESGLLAGWEEILQVLLEHDLAQQEVHLRSDRVGTSSWNRGGAGLIYNEVHSLGGDVDRLGICLSACAHATAAKVDATDTVEGPFQRGVGRKLERFAAAPLAP